MSDLAIGKGRKTTAPLKGEPPSVLNASYDWSRPGYQGVSPLVKEILGSPIPPAKLSREQLKQELRESSLRHFGQPIPPPIGHPSLRGYFDFESYTMVKDPTSKTTWFDYDPSLLSEEKTPSTHPLLCPHKSLQEKRLKVMPSSPATSSTGASISSSRLGSCLSAASNIAVD